MLRSAVWFLTMNCQNWCPYCWERQRQKRGEFTPEPFKDYKLWVEAWNRLSPEILDITGGEPSMQPGFIPMIKEIKNTRIAITTNLKFDVAEFVQEITPDKVFSITASYHPTSDMSKDEFIGKCLLLKGRGFVVTVNYVAYPEQMWIAPVLFQEFKAFGLRFHLDPYSPCGKPFKYTSKEKNFIDTITGADRKPEPDKRVVFCSAGKSHLSVQPDGTAYRCLNYKIFYNKPMGNILDKNFKLNKDMQECGDYWRCAGCDKDKVSIKDVAKV